MDLSRRENNASRPSFLTRCFGVETIRALYHTCCGLWSSEEDCIRPREDSRYPQEYSEPQGPPEDFEVNKADEDFEVAVQNRSRDNSDAWRPILDEQYLAFNRPRNSEEVLLALGLDSLVLRSQESSELEVKEQAGEIVEETDPGLVVYSCGCCGGDVMMKPQHVVQCNDCHTTFFSKDGLKHW